MGYASVRSGSSVLSTEEVVLRFKCSSICTIQMNDLGHWGVASLIETVICPNDELLVLQYANNYSRVCSIRHPNLYIINAITIISIANMI
jgi:hypothetical protein